MTPRYARRLASASGLGLTLLLAACSGGPSGSIATVNGTDVSRATFEQRIESSPVAKQVLTQLVQSVLIDQYATDHHIDVPAADIDKKIDELKGRYPAGQFDKLVQAQGMTIDDVKKIVRQQIVLQKAVDVDLKLSDSEIASYFAKNRELFNQPEQVHARHILVDSPATAAKVEADLKGGAKFEDEAAKYSKDPSTKDRGGDLGFFGRKQMVPAFESAAFSQPIGVVGQPVKSQFGYHIIEVLERKAAVTASLANSKDAIRKQLMEKEEAERIPAFLQGLQEKAKITVNDPYLKNAFMTPMGLGSGGPG